MIKTLALLPAGFLLAACGGGGGGDTGTLNLGVTDAPIDEASEVWVTFTGIELRSGGGDPIVIDFDDQQIELTDLTGGQSEFLIQDQSIPAGVYDDVRLFVAGTGNANCDNLGAPYANHVVTAEGPQPLIVPSGNETQSGYKVKGGITIAAGQRGDYTVDFDLRKSIAERGGTGCYNLKPVLRVVDNAQTGTLTGSVDPALLADASCAAVAEGDTATGAGSAVYVYEGSVTPDDFDGVPANTVGDTGPDPLTTANLTPVLADGVVVDYTYEVGFLLTGEYTVAFTCQAGNDAPPDTDPGVLADLVSDNVLVFVQPQPATITVDQTTVVDFTYTPPEPPPVE